MSNLIGNDWDDILKEQFESTNFKQIGTFLYNERQKGKIIYPEPKDYFKALKLTSYKDTKVVLLGQDCYPNGEADGLAFSVSSNDVIKIPPSLKSILEAIEEDIYSGFIIQEEWSLERLAVQGVLLLNKYLSVEKKKPLSHANIGWDIFTNSIIQSLSAKEESVIFLLLGKEAQKAKSFIGINHFVLECEHPAAATYNNRKWEYNSIFSKCNKILRENGKEGIEW